ncbi:putative tetratricopeptide-like helical domain-containing protein [Senna tora]|uniref:Putative tetratricopeptide-like helical domain-containing protein n=1 Tax=Senna tora TaxID=362788 RepID=A0A834TVG5_9FABA|nr:putative tetratricopeptide-like helical domain-containing protein [Senna tora]
MVKEMMLRVAILILTLAIVYIVHNLSKQAGQLRVRKRNRDTQQTNRHLIQGTRLLSRARSNSQRPQSVTHARSALIEADEALSLSPRDPAAHILKALALDLMGHYTAALKSMDSALSSPQAKSLSEVERENALVKRAELKVAVNRRRRIESAVEDLVEAVRISGGKNSEALCVLGECYEWKGMKDKAKESFERAFQLEPDSIKARNGLDRLGP